MANELRQKIGGGTLAGRKRILGSGEIIKKIQEDRRRQI